MIMILTGEAKEDFSYKYNMSNFNEYSEVLQNALIIEWLDSVGVYVEIIRNDDYFDYVVMDDWDYGFDTRQEATEKAIIKANEIYNEKET